MTNKLLCGLLFVPMLAMATDNPPPDPWPMPPPIEQRQRQHQGQEQAQKQAQHQTQTASANNEGVSQSVTFSEGNQAPSLGQGSVFIPECGAGGNAGGSGSGGAGFLGFAYVPAWCQDFKYAAWLISVGDKELACLVMSRSKVGERARDKGLRDPICVPPPVQLVYVPVPPPPLPEPVIPTAQCDEKVERVFEKCVAK